MSMLNIARVSELPVPLVENTIYIIRPEGSDIASMTFVGNTIDQVAHTMTSADIDADVNTAVVDALAANAPVKVVATYAELTALTPEVVTMAYVKDTTGDPLATTGSAGYVFDVAAGAWLPLPSAGGAGGPTTWADIQGKPNSTVEQIDTAVANSHTHDNMDVLDELSEVDGKLAYKGEPVSNVTFTANW